MLIGGIYKFRPGADQRVGLKRFQAWAPPSGFVFQGHWARADGTGGLFLAEAESAAAVFEATGAFSDLIEFDIVPVLDIMESVPVSMKVLSWIDSVS
ncbi:MAG TPA: DUF3303 family protein [Acidimicrobiales bacterium]|nr:DUF3303 family protein [Acidimicrobiales bacterium]